MNSGEFDHGICLLAEKLNTRAPELKDTSILQSKYNLEDGKITQKQFIHVVKKLCGFGTLQQQEQPRQKKIIVELQQSDIAVLTEIQLVIEQQNQQAKGKIVLDQFNAEGKHQLNWKFQSFKPSLELKGQIEFQ
eukprot:TRINITY_DN12066_c0_g1_i1.p1 TRINITY_DN12066_c0_g1~~TRINITY_DN12066_c0_g1_i1.p1  ORF type:complete len:134 (-),score=19.86 TRINITY_DN12066_c0_g1_i1:171-572(-)